MALYNDVPIILYRGEGNIRFFRGLTGSIRFTVSYPEAVHYANGCLGNPQVLVLDGVKHHKKLLYEGEISDASCECFGLLHLENDMCEAIVPLSDPKHLELIIEATERILMRHQDHPNYNRDKQRFDKLVATLLLGR